MSKTFNKVPDHQVVVFRDGKQQIANPGKAFKFTAEEVAQILAARPDSLRDPINESSDSGEPLGSADQSTLLREAQEQAEAEAKLKAEAQKQAEADRAAAEKKAEATNKATGNKTGATNKAAGTEEI